MHNLTSTIAQPVLSEFTTQRPAIAARLTRRSFGLAAAALAVPALRAQTVVKPATRPEPPELAAFNTAATPWALQGAGALRFFGFKAYDAYLWNASASANPLASKGLFALEIAYNTAIKGEEIVNVSLVEMARLKRLTDAQINTWTAQMKRTFPNVVSGDRLTGVQVPRVGTRFFMNGKLVSEINDPAFGEAFFAIWLDEGTKSADMRRGLLGLAAPKPAPITSSN